MERCPHCDHLLIEHIIDNAANPRYSICEVCEAKHLETGYQEDIGICNYPD